MKINNSCIDVFGFEIVFKEFEKGNYAAFIFKKGALVGSVAGKDFLKVKKTAWCAAEFCHNTSY